MNAKPPFFEPIRQRAAQRWDQLEHDPELAGPWHQLFKQVQNPRYVLSELLQNADDAGATEASASIEDGAFVFTHNGDDFIEEHFASLCSFGLSNKRQLHMIGFRGIGFKSTFSLGDTVELYTPTLSVSFHRQRFTEPQWVDGTPNDVVDSTQIRVAIRDAHRQREVEKNLQDWLKSPVSLLFFKHIRRLRISDLEVHWESLGSGPVPDTAWMALHADPDRAFLVARSGAEPFPLDALTEIKQERLLGPEHDVDFPHCQVEIVLGIKGRLYVVLPTGVETALPFACNAPFIQDPARLKIKDPETSPTNRWLLERVGSLAAAVMLQWLGHTSVSVAERSRAYGCFPDVDRDDNSLEGTCAATVEETFAAAIENQAFLLTDAGDLTPAHQSVIIPRELFNVWPAEQVAALLDGANRPAFSRYVSMIDREKLVHWGVIETISKDRFLSILQTKHLPKPEAWRGLLRLWAYVAHEITGYGPHASKKRHVCIVPVQGQDVLYSASEVVRLGEKRLLQSDADWEFLAAHLLVLNPNWPRFLAEQRRDTEEREAKNFHHDVDAACGILNAIGLEESSDVSAVVEQVALDFFRQTPVALSACVQLAQIAAKLGASVGQAFRFATQDRRLKAADHIAMYDRDGTLEGFVPDDWRASHLLHAAYVTSFDSCTPEEWLRWIASGRVGLHAFVPLVQTQSRVWGQSKIESELRKRGFAGMAFYRYRTSNFLVEDWDFEEGHWHHWTTLAKDDNNLWGHLVDRILAQPETYWSKAKSVRALQVATTGTKQAITTDPLFPAWIIKLRELPCLPDTRGFYRKPADLLRRTPDTESLMDVEPFIHGRLDTESTRPLLKLLGVRDTPTGPERLLDCLRALAKADKPPVHEVEKWYRRLDQMVDTCSTTDFANIKKALHEEKIILTEGAGWVKGSGVFLSSNEADVPGAAVMRASVRDLSLWRKIGIAERPTADLAIQWLKELPSGKALSQDDARCVRDLLARHAVRIWNECGHWLNLASEWAPTATLHYALTMQTLVPWSHLHQWVKQKTADCQRLPVEITAARPFSAMVPLAGCVEDRFHHSPLLSERPEHQPWLSRLGDELRRIALDDEAETTRVRALATALAETAWQPTAELEIIPYIDGIPAGTSGRAEVVWHDKVLYVACLPHAKLARLVPDRLGKVFGRPDITAALNYCYGRCVEDVTEYLEENFTLVPRVVVASPVDEATVSTNAAPATDTGAAPLSSSEASPADHAAAAVSDEGSISVAQPEDTGEPAQNSEEHAIEVAGREVTPQRARPHPRLTQPSLIERFARSQGFQKDGEDRFFHVNGSWIAKAHGDRFPWERGTASGDIVRHYWSKDHCLEYEPLELEADIWGLIEKFPDVYSLILTNPQGHPVEAAGALLCAMRNGGELTLYPATYRLVYDHDRAQ